MVAEYRKEVTRLMHFDLEIRDSEVKKIHKFIRGLTWGIICILIT